MQQNLNEEEEKTGKMKEEMEVEVKLYHDKQDRLTKRVETLASDLEEAKRKTEVATTERDAKSVEITELTDAEFQAFKDATSSVYDTYVPQIDPAVYELVCNKIDALRG